MLTKELDLNESLLEKYSVSIPRYTSYPTAPEWTEKFNKNDFILASEEGNKSNSPLSLYFHLPFCESQCYFCACNIVISKKKDITKPYLANITQEISNLSKHVDKSREIQQIHLGGGTPTFFSPEELKKLMFTVYENFTISQDCEAGIEIDPRVTTFEHLECLSKLGFNRLSMGIQDFNIESQEAINRVQSFELTERIFNKAKKLGFKSINVDLIYGLPYQTKDSFTKTMELILKLGPDRVALFHYAHLPQLIPHQQKFIKEETLPSSKEKIKIFKYAVETFLQSGYVFIGLDHFAKPDDELAIAKKKKTLHRNFQGYTTKAGCDLYGFGITAISNVQNTFSQNIKKINPYYEKIEQNALPVYRGFVLAKDDLLRKEIIMKILCHGNLVKSDIEEKYSLTFDNYFSTELTNLIEFEKEGLIELDKDVITVTDLGQFFLRNIASTFDYYLQSKNGKQKIFSKSI